MKRELLLLMGCAALTLALSAIGIQTAFAQAKPNFVIIVADDLGYGDASCYGSAIQTPHIDQLAKEGLKFTDFHSNGPNCSSTRCALMTGRYQQRAGIDGLVGVETGMDQEEFTIAEAMKSAGYTTALFGKWHLGEQPEFNPTTQGFDEFKGHLTGRIDYFTHHAAGGDHEPDWWNGLEALAEEGCSTTLIADHSIDFIRRSATKPFFLCVSFNAPHTPIQDPATGDKLKTAEGYTKVVQDMDRNVGRLAATLKELGIEGNTLVFFCSDNGASKIPAGASNGPLNGWKGTLWEGGHRVPAIAWWPGRIPGGRITDQTALTMDIMPTCMELAGATLAPERALDGVSLLSLLFKDAPLPSRKLYWRKGSMTSMRHGPWKLLLERGSVYLFDLDDDLSEKTNLAAQQPERVNAMQAEIGSWAKEIGNVVSPDRSP